MCVYLYIYIYTHIYIYIYIYTCTYKEHRKAAGSLASERSRSLYQLGLGGTTCLTLLVECDLVCFLRRHLSNATSWISYIIRHFRIKHVLDK